VQGSALVKLALQTLGTFDFGRVSLLEFMRDHILAYLDDGARLRGRGSGDGRCPPARPPARPPACLPAYMPACMLGARRMGSARAWGVAHGPCAPVTRSSVTAAAPCPRTTPAPSAPPLASRPAR
jgi:hypothetical protein